MDDRQIGALPLLHNSGNYWAEFLADLPDGKLLTSHGLRLSTTGLCLDATLAGQGVALASRFLVSRELLDGRLVQITPRSLIGPKTYHILRRRDAPTNASMDAFHGWLLSTRNA